MEGRAAAKRRPEEERVLAMLSDTQRRQVKELFDAQLQNPVQVLFYYADPNDQFTTAMQEILSEMESLSGGKIKATQKGGREGQAEAARYRVDQAPAMVLLDKDGNDTRIRFYGATVGYEFMVFLEDLIDVSRGVTRLSEAAREQIRAIDQDVVVQVFSTAT